MAAVDSLGNPLSEAQIDFFKNSVIRDGRGNLQVCYHGSGKLFNEFDSSRKFHGKEAFI